MSEKDWPKRSPDSHLAAAAASGEAACIASTWPEPRWAHWLAVETVTMEEAAALSINKEPGARRAVGEVNEASAVHWMIPEHTWPEGRRRLLALRQYFQRKRITLSELQQFIESMPSAERWTVPHQLEQRRVAQSAPPKRYEATRDYFVQTYGRLWPGIGNRVAQDKFLRSRALTRHGWFDVRIVVEYGVGLHKLPSRCLRELDENGLAPLPTGDATADMVRLLTM